MKTMEKLSVLGRPAMLAASLGMLTVVASVAIAGEDAFLPRAINSSTIPGNGDLNPYGVAFVPSGFPGGGKIASGDVLVSNFNNAANAQGTGTSIIQLKPSGPIAAPGSAATFFTSELSGLSTALGVLRGGFVIVGNVPTTDGKFDTIAAGALQVIDRHGKSIRAWTDRVLLDGPWDLTIDDHGSTAHIFVSNVLNGTVVRLDVTLTSDDVHLQKKTLIANGYKHVPNSAALVLGPTGLAFDAHTDTLYVASTADNAIYAVSSAAHRSGAAAKGELIFSDPHLRGPLALRFAPNGNLLTANGDAIHPLLTHPSEIVEFTRWGQFIREYNVDASQGGAFGIDTVLDRDSDADADADRDFNFAAVDDVTNNLWVIRLPQQ